MRDFEHSLPMLLLRAREAAMSYFRPMLAAHGLTEQQWRVLRVLQEDNGVDSAALARRTLMLRPSLTGVLDRLQRDGLVQRRRDARDGRRICIWMTRRARRLYERVAPESERLYAEIQKDISREHWDQLHASLRHLVELNHHRKD